MKRLLIAAALVLALPGCAFDQSAPQSVSNVASKATTAANDFYRAASAAGEALVKAGLLDKAKFQHADAEAYAVLVQVRVGRATFAQLVAATAPLTGANK